MKAIKYPLYFVLCTFVLSLASCEPRPLTPEDVYTDEKSLEAELAEENPEGYKIYGLNEFLDEFMTEEGNYLSDSSLYRTRATTDGEFYMFSVDTLPTDGPGIYIRGRITTDDYGGNFYKAMVIQRIVNGKQENLRVSVDLGSSAGMFQLGQEIVIRCNGFAVGRYSNQPQLCVPSYNNNIFAMNANQKVGWVPGRIPGPEFKKAARFVGLPDQSKLQYDTLTIEELFDQVPKIPTVDEETMDQVRKADGRLVVLKNVYFTGQYDDNGTLKECDTQNPDSSGSANVFAPTTKNIGYPQSRLLSDGAATIMCSNSEYAKFAYFYLPGADATGVEGCPYWEGTVTGILEWYQDQASKLTKLTGNEWSVKPRGIPGFGIPDIQMYNYMLDLDWIPEEYSPNVY